MARSNWNWYASGAWDTSSTYKVSGSRSLRGSSADTRFLYSAATYTNVMVEAQVMNRSPGNYTAGIQLHTRWNQLTPISNGYTVYMFAYSANSWLLGLERYNGGVSTSLRTYAGITVPTGTAMTDWFKVRFSTATELSAWVSLKVEIYLSSVWRTWFEYMDTSVSRITAAGYAGMGFKGAVVGQLYADDVKIYSLA